MTSERVSARRGKALQNKQDSPEELVHVHECSYCGRFSFPEEFSSRDNVTGLYECPNCQATEALNVKIVRRMEVDRRS